jgi:glycine/D-amino acid oxidase-like deaminating enzyme
MKVTRQPKNPGPAAWAKILPDAAHHPMLEDDRHVDFLIIGAGFAGLTAARRISELEPTATVAVVEAFRLAEGPAGRNSGFMIDLPHDLASDDYGGQAARDHQSIRHNRAAISPMPRIWSIRLAFRRPVSKKLEKSMPQQRIGALPITKDTKNTSRI